LVSRIVLRNTPPLSTTGVRPVSARTAAHVPDDRDERRVEPPGDDGPRDAGVDVGHDRGDERPGIDRERLARRSGTERERVHAIRPGGDRLAVPVRGEHAVRVWHLDQLLPRLAGLGLGW
jgi:hypothetical protein